MSRLPFLLMDLAQEVAALGGSPAPAHIALTLDQISFDAVASAVASHYGSPSVGAGPLVVHGIEIRPVAANKQA